jgi:enamine deaminase RidA (YjgF/YER057c/UK114 family)
VPAQDGYRAAAMNQVLSPASIAAPAARYSHGVVSAGGSAWLHTAGVVPVRPDGTTPNALAEQAEVVWANIDAILVEGGMGRTDIVSVTTYVVPGQDMGAVMAARTAYLGEHLAASTLVIVAALVRPEWKVETAVVAARAR